MTGVLDVRVVLDHVRSVVLDHLRRCGPNPPQRAVLAAGGIVIDTAEGGLLIVAPERVFRARTPLPTEAPGDEDVAMIGVALVVRIERCVPVLDDSGAVPDDELVDAAFAQIITDAAIVWEAVTSDDMTIDGDWERASVDQVFVGPEGGNAGSETRLTLGIPEAFCVVCSEVYEGET